LPQPSVQTLVTCEVAENKSLMDWRLPGTVVSGPACLLPLFYRDPARPFREFRGDMNRSISVFGLGYVGTVTAACLAHKGNQVIGVDLSPTKVEAIEAGRSPIVEPRVNEIVAESHSGRRLHATGNAADAVLHSEISFLCVGTPSLRNGKLDLGHIGPVCREIGQALKQKDAFHLVVLRSTVLPGTAESIVVPTLEESSGKSMGQGFGVCVNPEFMREGTAVADFLEPAMTIIGASDRKHSALLREIYAWAPGRIFETSFRSAEMVKYVCNAWHAVKVAFANEVGTLAKQLNVDAEAVTEIFTADTKLNLSPAYLKPGFAFGGSCLPKDVRALNYRARELDLTLPLFESLMPSNEEHLERAIEMILETGKRRIGMLGLSFKAATDDLRESPQVQLAKRLMGEGREIRIWDNHVALGRLIGSNRQYIEEVIPHIGSLLVASLEEVLEHAEVVVIGTRGIDRDALEPHLRPAHTVIDLVNLEKARRPSTAAAYDGICW
jgi:GDP-mannose 6-dehydrogenase